MIVARAFEELGPAVVKLCQLLASRTRVLPWAYSDELAKLHDQVPPVAYAEVEAMPAAELTRDRSNHVTLHCCLMGAALLVSIIRHGRM